MDKALALQPLGSDTYTSIHPSWQPPWARGVYGGTLMAQALCAAQETIPGTFSAHSLNCSFLSPALASEPIIYHVERLRDGGRFAVRAVRARQQEQEIFCATVSFSRGGKSSKAVDPLAHAAEMPSNIPLPPDDLRGDSALLSRTAPMGNDAQFECIRCGPPTPGAPTSRKLRQWIRARKSPSSSGLPPRWNLAALAYMTDAYFIGAVSRVHGTRRFDDAGYIQRMAEGGNVNSDTRLTSQEKGERRAYFEALAREERVDNEAGPGSEGAVPSQVDMLVTLNHAIYFHRFSGFSAEEWMLAEIETPWAGDERGLVIQRIWSQDGQLLATCVQEGVVRLKGVEVKL
ncbi:thioesterase-like superfamily-domain-containing protein [Aspergillus unguis]